MKPLTPIPEVYITGLQEDFAKVYPMLNQPIRNVLVGLLHLICKYNDYMLADYKSIGDNKKPEPHSRSVRTLQHIAKLYIDEGNSMGHWPEGSIKYEPWLQLFIAAYIDPQGQHHVHLVRAISILEGVSNKYQLLNPTVSSKIAEAIALLDEAHTIASK